MDRSNLKIGALLENDGSPSTMDGTSSKMNPLKTTKQRNTSNNHRKNQQRSTAVAGRSNSTDEDDRGDRGHASLPVAAGFPTGLMNLDEEGFRKCDGDNENENTTNNDEQSGFVDSENDNIAERLCSLSKLSLHSASVAVGVDEETIYTPFCEVAGGSVPIGGSGINYSTEAIGFSPHSVAISKIRNPSYPVSSSFHESDSISEVNLKNHFVPVQSSSGCPGATTGDGDGISETMDDSAGRRFRRRRRRRGHNTNTKRMAVEASDAGNDGLADKVIRSAERPGPSGTSHKKFNKLDKTNPLDAFGMKRKRTMVTNSVKSGSDITSQETDGNMDMGDVGSLSLNSPEMAIEDQEMKSDDEDECSSCESVDEVEEDDRGREGDDEQSDWFDDLSSNPNKSKEESASSRKKRLLKMLRSYNDMISANVGGGGSGGSVNSNYQIQTREIRAGKRRVFISKPGFPTKGIWTSANEEVSKFLQDPLQSQIRLQPISAEEGVQLTHLASLYSLRMDYCNNLNEEQNMEEVSRAEDDDVDSSNVTKLIPVLTKTHQTTQMDKMHHDSTVISSPFNAEGSSSSNVSSVYGPTHSDVDSRTSDSKRIKK